MGLPGLLGMVVGDGTSRVVGDGTSSVPCEQNETHPRKLTFSLWSACSPGFCLCDWLHEGPIVGFRVQGLILQDRYLYAGCGDHAMLPLLTVC